MIIHRRREPTPTEAARLPRGYEIAGYRVDRVLGSGGMGAVYQATQLSLKRSVALKVIAAGVPIDATLRQRFRREGQLQAVIDHPHILPVYEAGEDHGRLFIAMRLVRGHTLKQLAAARALDQERSMRILGDVARALDAAHGAGLLHRDVKPQNILVDAGDHAYLADFGLSKAPGEETLTRAGQLLGSISYMSPEQVRGEPATAASDIYSFTCVMYECLVGLVPFPRESDHAVLHAHVWEPPPRPSEIRSELPPTLDEVIAHGMAKAPDARPTSARALIDEARSALGLEPDLGDEVEATAVLGTASDESSSTRLSASVDSGAGRRGARSRMAVLGLIAVVTGASAGWLIAREPGDGPAAKTTTVATRGSSQPEARYAKQLSGVFAALSSAQPTLEQELAKAAGAGAQASALAALAAEYRKAHAALARSQPPAKARSVHAAISVALERIADGYRRLEVAARHRNRSAYNAGRAALAGDEKRLKGTLERLQRLGYKLA